MKYVVVTGGVVSGLGKGITISSIGVLLKAAGVRVTSIKIDPYLNCDAGTMSPFEHGEVYVLDDGGEADLDLGNYERFLDVTLSKNHNITTGKVYREVIERERKGDYLGKTVQVIPHVTTVIQDWIERVAAQSVDRTNLPPDVCLVEVGGTVGDIESLVFLEALRQFKSRVGDSNIVFLHVSLVPVIGAVGEQKTKPTQHSVKELRSVGISPDFLICRSSTALDSDVRAKLGQFCQVAPAKVIAVHDVSNIYHVPLLLEGQNLTNLIASQLNIGLPRAPELTAWRGLASRVDNLVDVLDIALVGKYTGLQDSYLSVIKALKHAAVAANRKLTITWVEATGLEAASEATDPKNFKAAWDALKTADGILVPGGFGNRGTEGIILAAKYARENKKPYFGICLGMQLAVIEYARSVLGLAGANSTEFNPDTPHPVVIFMPEITKEAMGGTMRLGSRATLITTEHDGKPTLAAQIHGVGVTSVTERHRHRYEVNPEYVDRIAKGGLRFTGTDESKQRMEIVELDRAAHPFFFAAQYHPEFLSRPYHNEWSPPFLAFVYAAVGQLADRLPLPPRHALAASSPTSFERVLKSPPAARHAAPFPSSPAPAPAAGAGAGTAADDESPAKRRRAPPSLDAPASPSVVKLVNPNSPAVMGKLAPGFDPPLIQGGLNTKKRPR